MEVWQKAHITKNLTTLIENIKCDVILLSSLRESGVLGLADDAKLVAVGKSEGELAQSKLLLDILVTRTDAYKHLLMTLKKCNQVGAFDILMKGVHERAPVDNVLLNVAPPMLEDERTTFRSNSVGSSNIGTEPTASTSRDTFPPENHQTKARDTIPEAFPYYIPRTLSLSNHLDEIIFHQLENDIFCVESIEKHQFSFLVQQHGNKQSRWANYAVEESSNQILRPRLTTRFIILERHEHFPGVTDKTNKIVHWLKHCSGKLTYVKSSTENEIRRIKVFIKCNNPEVFSEDEFVQKCLHETANSPVLLYDSPGMGKSMLLAELARNVKENAPDRSVIYFQLPELVSQLRDAGNSSAALKESFMNIISRNVFGHNVTENPSNLDNLQLELLLDAYDEIQETDLANINSVLDDVANEYKNFRMFITTRPHRRHELEDRFGVLGYNIMPFDDANKLSFFLKYWQNHHQVEVTEETKQFAKYCLKSVTKSTFKGESDIAGSPLQCKMLADIFAEYAHKGALECTDLDLQFTSIFSMYKKFMDIKFSSLSSDTEKQEVKEFHVKTAMSVICGDAIDIAYIDCRAVKDETIYSIGILEPSKSHPGGMAFVHRTFAEFFVAEYLVTTITGKSPHIYGQNITIIDLLLGICLAKRTEKVTRPRMTSGFYLSSIILLMLHTRLLLPNTVSIAYFNNTVIVYFLDFFLSDIHFEEHDFKDFKVLLRKSAYYKSPTLLTLISGSLSNNAIHLFTFLLQMFLDVHKSDFIQGEVDSKCSVYPDSTFCNRKLQLFHEFTKKSVLRQLVWVACEYSSLELVERMCRFVEIVTGMKWCNLGYSKFSYGPVYVTVERGHYGIFDYLLKFDRTIFNGKAILYYCLEDSVSNTPEVVNEKVQIVKRILREWPDLVHTNVHLEAHKVHFELITCVIEAGASINATTIFRDNIAHQVAWWFSADEYHEFVTWTISRNANEIFKQRSSDGTTPVHRALWRIDLKTETLELLANHCNADFNDNKNNIFWGESELSYAIKAGRSERVINDILRLGGDNNKMYRYPHCVIQ